MQWTRGRAPHLYDLNVCEVFRVEATGKGDRENTTCAHESCSGAGEMVRRENNAVATGLGNGS